MYTTQKRRILTALLAFVLLTSAGCAGNTTKETDTGAESGTTATAETVDSTETDPYADVDFGGQCASAPQTTPSTLPMPIV